MHADSTSGVRRAYATEEQIASALRQARYDYVRSGKEFIRHAALKMGASSVIDHYSRKRGYLVLRGNDASSVFSKIYSEGGWVHSQSQESRSGLGSSVAATAGLFTELQNAMRHLGCRSLIDIGCGDWNWMGRETISFEYTGIDVVPDVIAGNSKHTRENVRFKVCDVTADIPPSADMALCREVLFHLSFADAAKALANISKAVKYICATSDTVNWFNSDIPTGGYRPLNLFKKPFGFPLPVYMIDDSLVTPGRFLGIWRADQIAA